MAVQRSSMKSGWILISETALSFQTFKSQAAKNILSYIIVTMPSSQLLSLMSITMCAQQSEWENEK